MSFVLAQQIALDIREFKVPSTHIGIFLNPQPFLFGFTTFPVHTWRIQIEFACLHDGIDPDSLKCVQSVRHKARDSGGKYALFAFR